MSGPPTDKFRALLAREDWDQLGAVLLRIDPSVAADLFIEIPVEQQAQLFGRLPIEYAAAVVEIVPYYDAHVLLLSRTSADRVAILDKVKPAERLRLFEELPEQFWQSIRDELAAADLGAASVAGSIVAEQPPVETIIQARQ